jgi:hypothetical protein
MMTIKNTIRIEEAGMFSLSIFLFSQTGFAWWWYPVLILLPDLGMLGYLAGNRAGAFTYNLFHHKAIAIGIFSLGWYLGIPWIELGGIILFGRSSMDRMLDYGLKYTDSFQHTHLGWLKKGNDLNFS